MKTRLLYWFFFSLAWYSIISLMQWNFNVLEWKKDSFSLFVMISALILIFSLTVQTENNENGKH